LIANLDPFHDNQLKDLTGWPDEETAASVIRIIKQSLTLSAPPAVAGNWDAELVLFPFLDILNVANVGRTVGGNTLFDANTGRPVAPLGGLTIFSKASGPASFDMSADWRSNLVLAPAYSKGVGRIIGIGFEVTNTTSDLYRQGLVTVFRQSIPVVDSGVYSQITGQTHPAIVECIPYRQPPLNTADALLYPGSRQWRAEDGCYMVSPFVGGDNPPQAVGYTQPLIMIDDDVSFVPNVTNVWAPLYNLAGTIATYRGTKHYPFHMNGAIFSGLSNQTTLQVNLNIIYESFPSVSEPDILVLAKPSCTYDPVALSAMSRVLSTLPVGVPAGMNASGDWFYDLVSTIAEYAPKIGDLIPGGGLIGQGVGSLADIGLSYMTPPGSTAIPQSAAKEARKKKKNDQRRMNDRKRETADAIKEGQTNKKPKPQSKGTGRKQPARARK